MKGEQSLVAWQQSNTLSPSTSQPISSSDLRYIAKQSTPSFQILPFISSLIFKLVPSQKLFDPLLDLFEKTQQEQMKWQQIKQEEDLNTCREPFHFQQYNKIFVQPFSNKWDLK